MKKDQARTNFILKLMLNLIAIGLYSGLVIVAIYVPVSNWSEFFLFFSGVFICSLPAYFITDNFLVPHLLYQRKFTLLVFGVLFNIVLGAMLCVVVCIYIIMMLYPSAFGEYHSVREVIINESADCLYYLYFFSWNFVLIIFTSGAIRIFYSKKKLEVQTINVENEKIISEMSYLRDKLNPDFLLSMMDEIKRSIENEDTSVNKAVDTFVNLLYYQLYECAQDKIEIEKEIRYVESYVNIQSNRLEEGFDVRFVLGYGLQGFYIPPLMILPLIENAFKHKSHFKYPQDNKIHINIYKSNNTTLNIIVKNTYEELYEGKTLNKNPHGVGLSNLKRRLELWSDNRYALETYIKDGFYNSKLTLSV